MTKGKSLTYIKGFDGLRAISILFVLFTHLGLYEKIKGIDILEQNFYLISGTSGVMIFFSISGFLITSLLLHEKKSLGRIHFRHFFIRRFLRLLPPLLVFYLAIFLLMEFRLIPQNYTALVISFFYLYNFVPIQYYIGELGHTWSLGVEEQFYLLWPFVINRIIKIKSGLFIAGFIILICLLFKYFSKFPFYIDGSIHYLKNYGFVERWFIPACLPIMVGAVTSLVFFLYQDSIQKYFQSNPLFLVIAIMLYTAESYMPFWSPYVSFLCMPIAVSLVLLWIYFNQNSILVNLFEVKPVAFLGKISYGVYVYQGLFLRTGPGGSLAIQKFPLNIVLVFVTAILSYYLLEKRVLKYKTKFRR
ncbi:MAG: acyltransferase [Flavobacteriales bacterium]|nr:acyltransferase [Flavobacteriales bacterium]